MCRATDERSSAGRMLLKGPDLPLCKRRKKEKKNHSAAFSGKTFMCIKVARKILHELVHWQNAGVTRCKMLCAWLETVTYSQNKCRVCGTFFQIFFFQILSLLCHVCVKDLSLVNSINGWTVYPITRQQVGIKGCRKKWKSLARRFGGSRSSQRTLRPFRLWFKQNIMSVVLRTTRITG